jgi:voltage-gated potassium channel
MSRIIEEMVEKQAVSSVPEITYNISSIYVGYLAKYEEVHEPNRIIEFNYLVDCKPRLFKYSAFTEVLKVFRIVRIFRYSKGIRTIIDILKSSKKALFAVGSLAVGYILISALVVFNVEPDTFNSFFDAVYWSTVSLTTVGYGDIYPVTVIGRTIAMLSSFFGIAIVALPAGIVTAEYMKSINTNETEKPSDDKYE